MKDELIVKYCPECKKEVAVQKDGNNHQGKQNYKCKKCGRQFIVDKKYPNEIQGLAVALYRSKKNYHAVAKVLAVAPNTVRNWVNANIDYQMPDREQLKVLRQYQTVCDRLNDAKKKIVQLGNALKIKKIQNEKSDVEKDLTKPIVYLSKLQKLDERRKNLENEIGAFGENKYTKYSETKIRKLQSETKAKIESLEEDKIELESKSMLASEKYDLDAIIAVLEKLTANKNTAR